MIGEKINKEKIIKTNKAQFKKYIKEKVWYIAFGHLKDLQSNHKKVSNIVYTDCNKPQQYLVSPLFSNSEHSLLFNPRSQCVQNVRKHFSKMYGGNVMCLLCSLGEDRLEHILSYEAILKSYTGDTQRVTYEDVFSSVEQQK